MPASATSIEYIGKEADRWEEDSHFGADEDSSIGMVSRQPIGRG